MAENFLLFSHSFSALLATPKTRCQEILTALLQESLVRDATDINIEPAWGDTSDIYFRIAGTMHQIMHISGSLTETLRYAIHDQVKDFHLGKYNVNEGSLALQQGGQKYLFNVFIIPQQSRANNIIIRPTITRVLTGQPRPAPPKKNIDKKIFIWQMGKVGSLTVFHSLAPYSKPSAWLVPSIKKDTRWPIYNNIVQTHSIQLLYDFLHYSDEEFVIISLVRDLMARNISTIFQSMNFEENWRNDYFIANTDDFQKMSYDQQEQAITDHLKRLNTSTVATSWYDNILKSHIYYPDIDKYFIDIYAKPFDQDNGYQIYESKNPRIQMIILRLEDLAAQKNTLGEFLGIENLHLVSKNVADKKWYQPIYKKFKERYKPTLDELEAVYNSRFMKYFYSPAQIEVMLGSWNKS